MFSNSLVVCRSPHIPDVHGSSPAEDMKKISEEKKNSIVNLLEKGIPARQIAKQLQVDEKTVRKIRDEVCPAAKKSKGGRPAKISEATTRRIQRAITSGKANTATEVARQLRNDAIANVHPITVRRALRRVGLVSRKKIKKPRLQDRHKKLRVEFAKKARKLDRRRLESRDMER